MPTPDIQAAQQFLASTARVLDRRRYETLFAGADPEPVVHALAAYRNPDGGFGHALEPDTRAPASQPLAVERALRTLDEVDAWDGELVRAACDWLERNAPGEGGATFVDPSLDGWPRAPWMVPEEGPSLISTGLIAGTLHARAVEHPWLARATEVMWARLDSLESGGAYTVEGALAFLQHVPDRQRAEAAFDRLAPLIEELVELDPDAPGEIHGPLNFAPLPESLARRLFDERTIERHLDHLAGGQLEDGGWSFNWLAWLPAATADWRGSLTVDALRLLRANGRL